MDLLRSTLQPITHNLPTPIRSAATSLLGATCYDTLILNIDPTHTACLKLAVSKSLGIGIIGASSIVKIPQILKLLNSQSAEGVSFLSYLLETSSYLVSLAYNARQGFPFSTYGETALIAAQNVVIAVLVLQFGGRSVSAGLFVAGLAAAGYALFDGAVVDMGMLSYLQAGAGVLGVASKLPQILAVYQQGGTGQLSAFAVFNYLVGSLTRIFTTMQEVDDKLILYGFIAGFLLNAVLAAQMIYYWRGPQTASHAGEISQKAEKIAMTSRTSAAPKSKTPTTRRRG
ncbi:hypothetical protein MMC06_001374 [Schaereria dolodes]|nr:hypothetical protein [Schaereria dolodes]